jgi:pimeloyl-ACP methyl ester carboxylesterase
LTHISFRTTIQHASHALYQHVTAEPVVNADLLQIPAGPGSLHVERYGLGGPPVVLLPAFGTSAFLWRAIAPSLAEHGFVVYAIDPMGYGESDRPFDGDYSVAAQAEYLRTAVGSLRLERAALVGVEIGAGIALRLAITAPDMVSTLVLVSPVAFEAWPAADVRRLQNATARHAVRLAHGVLGAAVLLEPLLREGVAKLERMPARLVARYLAPYTGTDGAVHLLDLARALHTEDLEDLDLLRIRARTIIVRGDADRTLPASISARLHAGIPGSTLIALSDAARLVPEDAPRALLTILTRALSGESISDEDRDWNET